MKTPTLAAIAALALLAAASAEARTEPLPISTESRVWFTGASNIRRFTCRAGELEGRVELLRGVPLGETGGRAPAEAGRLRIAVARLDCGLGAMNRHLRETLRADAHPAVDFRLDSYELTGGDALRLEGALTIAGTEKPVTIAGAAERDGDGVLHVRGSHELRVTDFGVEPPRRFLGLMKVRDRVTVHFDVVLGTGTAGVPRLP